MEHCRSARGHGGRSHSIPPPFRPHSARAARVAQLESPAGSRPGVRAARPAAQYPFRRGEPKIETRRPSRRIRPRRRRRLQTDLVPVRRTDDRPALRRRARPPEGFPAPRRCRTLGARHRTQSGRHPIRRLAYRPVPRRRRGRRAARRARNARTSRRLRHQPHRPSPARNFPADLSMDSSRESHDPEVIAIHGAREHNLKNLSLTIPRNRFVVITGVSGSGKSTLAFDLLFAEGQRRFLDSMNTYARQFVEQLSRPDVDLITGIPPTVSIEQRTTRGGGKSTVATVTEIYHFIRLLFARLGTQYCPDCQVPVEAQTRDELGRRLQSEVRKRGELLLLAPVVKNRKGFHTDVAEWAASHGYEQVRADGKLYDSAERLRLDRFREHNVEIVTGTLRKTGSRLFSPSTRETDGVKGAQQLIDETLKLGNGTLLALDKAGAISIHSTERS